MKERPILFSGPMIRALLAGTKTQTRRVVKPQPDGRYYVRAGDGNVPPGVAWLCEWDGDEHNGMELHQHTLRCHYGQPGDRLWVREAWAPGDLMVFGAAKDDPETVLYRADQAALHWDGKAMRTPMNTYAFNWGAVRWKPSIHMPRWASRITLEITGVHVERLQDISAADAEAEGTLEWAKTACAAGNPYELDATGYFELLWSAINGRTSWDANPWVWVVEFKRITL